MQVARMHYSSLLSSFFEGRDTFICLVFETDNTQHNAVKTEKKRKRNGKKIQMEFEQMVDALEFKLQPKVFVEYSSTLRARLGLLGLV